MAAVNRAIKIEQGATFTLGFNWHKEGPVVDDVVTPGDPYDLTGWSARMQVRKSVNSPVLLNGSTQNGRIIMSEEGRVDIKFTDEDTDVLTVKSALYDLELENPEGDVFRLLEGAVTISPNITRDAP